MSYEIKWTSRFKREYKRAERRGQNIAKLNDIVNRLSLGSDLPPEFKDHELKGRWSGHRECHIEPDWLLIYIIRGDILVLSLVATGTHSDLFGE